MSDRIRDIIAKADRMQADRGVYLQHCQEVRDFIYPLAMAVNRVETLGQKSNDKVLDNSGETAHELLAATIVSTLTPSWDDFFGLRAANEQLNRSANVAFWLEDAAGRMNKVFRSGRGGFSTAQHEKYLDVTGMGTAGGFIADRPGRGIIFNSVPLRQLLLAENADGKVDQVYRDFKLSARQAVGRWGRKCGAKVQEAASDPKKEETQFRFIHAVEPRQLLDSGKRDRLNMPMGSEYVCVEDKHMIDEGGFQEMPYSTPRWTKRADEVYGRGCGMKALADVRMLQRTMKVTIRGGEKMIDPPLMVADDGVVGPIRSNANGITYYRSGTYSIDPIKALLTGGRPDIGEEIMQGVRTRIDNAFLKPVIQMIRKDRMTATEVLQVTDENQRILSPYTGRLMLEDLEVMIERVFGIMMRGGAFLPLPTELQGQTLVIEYVSPAVKSQRVARARALAQFNEITAPMVQMDQALADNLDADLAYRDTADALGLPKDWMRDTDKVGEMRQARQQAQAQALQQKQAMEGIETAANAVRALPALKAMQAGGADAAA